jgi:hypothetical protein
MGKRGIENVEFRIEKFRGGLYNMGRKGLIELPATSFQRPARIRKGRRFFTYSESIIRAWKSNVYKNTGMQGDKGKFWRISG